MNVEIEHTDVGAYALGLLEETDRYAFEAHLASCVLCHEELASLRGVASSLNGMPFIESLPETPATDAVIVTDLVQRRADLARRNRRTHAMLSAAAGIVLVAGGATIGIALTGDDGAPATRTARPAAAPPADGAQALLANGQRVTAADPQTGVSGVIAMEPKAWGSRVALQLSGVRGPLECQLVAVTGAGQARVVTGWAVPDRGYGVAGAAAPLTVQGGVGLQATDIDRFEVRASDGRNLLTIRT